MRGATSVGLLALILLASCGGGNQASQTQARPALHLVAIGDSLARDTNCAGCNDFVDLYAKALARATGRAVKVDNLSAFESPSVAALDASHLLTNLRTSDSLRLLISRADAVIVNVGFNDTPWNRIDDPCRVAPQYPVVRWQKITTECARRVTADYRRRLDATLSQIDDLREGKRTEVRVVTVYNSTIGDDVDPSWGSPGAARVSVEGNNLFAQAQCEEATAHRGLCADVYHGMNGPEGTRPAALYLGPDYTHLNQDGHTLVAHTLEQLGYSPLTR